jgi:hypothetical protein
VIGVDCRPATGEGAEGGDAHQRCEDEDEGWVVALAADEEDDVCVVRFCMKGDGKGRGKEEGRGFPRKNLSITNWRLLLRPLCEDA